MTALASVSSWLEHFHGPVAYLVVGSLVFAETGLFIGFFFPGETAALVGGALASLHYVNLGVMLCVVVGLAIAGNAVGYHIGKLVGPWLLSHRPLRGHNGIRRAEAFVAQRGGPGVFLGRWVAVVRALVPGIAGMSGMNYGTFMVFTVIGGVTWGATYVMVGFAAGTTYGAVARTVGLYSVAVLGAVIVAGLVWLAIRRHQRSAAN